MPTLSSLYDKFIRRAALTTEEKTDIRADIGAGTPPTTESVLALLPEFYPENYGAVGNGTTDDSAAFNSMFAAIPASGGVVQLRAVPYLVANLTCSKPVKIVGSGMGPAFQIVDPTIGTRLINPSRTAPLLTVVASSIVVSDVHFLNPQVYDDAALLPTAGHALKMDVTGLGSCQISRCRFSGFYDGIIVNDGASWFIADSSFDSPVRDAIRASSLSATDNGDYHISGNAFFGTNKTYFAGAAFHLLSGGGVRFTNNKVNGYNTKFTHGVLIEKTNTGSSILVCVANSFENIKTSAVRVSATGASGVYGFVQVIGNEIALMDYGVEIFQNTYSSRISDNIFSGIVLAAIRMGGTDDCIGSNTYDKCAIGIQMFESAVNPLVAREQHYTRYVAGTPRTLVDYFAIGGGHPLAQSIKHNTAGIYTGAIYKITVFQYNGGLVKLSAHGFVSGVGHYKIVRAYSYLREAGDVSVTGYGTDLAIGSALGVINYELIAASASEITIRIARSSNASSLGYLSFEVEGAYSKIERVD